MTIKKQMILGAFVLFSSLSIEASIRGIIEETKGTVADVTRPVAELVSPAEHHDWRDRSRYRRHARHHRHHHHDNHERHHNA